MMIAFLLLFSALFVAFMVVYIDNDGHGRMPEFRHPPRSHHADVFEPRTLV
jgi:hypothetical protein